jgi:hypothetical protein
MPKAVPIPEELTIVRPSFLILLAAIVKRLRTENADPASLLRLSVDKHNCSCKVAGRLHREELACFLAPFVPEPVSEVETTAVMRYLDPDDNGYSITFCRSVSF